MHTPSASISRTSCRRQSIAVRRCKKRRSHFRNIKSFVNSRRLNGAHDRCEKPEENSQPKVDEQSRFVTQNHNFAAERRQCHIKYLARCMAFPSPPYSSHVPNSEFGCESQSSFVYAKSYFRGRKKHISLRIY